MKRTLYALIGIVGLAAAIGGWAYAQATEGEARQEERLLALADRELESGYAVSAKIGAVYQAYAANADVARQGERLAERLGLPLGALQADDEGHPVYRAQLTTTEGVSVRLSLVGMPDEGATYLLAEIAGSRDKLEAAKRERDRVAKALAEDGLHPKWRVNAQGLLKRQTDAYAASLPGKLAARTGASVVGSYRDERSIGASYYGAGLGPSVGSGDKRINLQIALHKNTTDNRWTATFGTPAITVS